MLIFMMVILIYCEYNYNVLCRNYYKNYFSSFLEEGESSETLFLVDPF